MTNTNKEKNIERAKPLKESPKKANETTKKISKYKNLVNAILLGGAIVSGGYIYQETTDNSRENATKVYSYEEDEIAKNISNSYAIAFSELKVNEFFMMDADGHIID